MVEHEPTCTECNVNIAGPQGVCEDCFYGPEPYEIPFEPECGICNKPESFCICDSWEAMYKKEAGLL